MEGMNEEMDVYTQVDFSFSGFISVISSLLAFSIFARLQISGISSFHYHSYSSVYT